MRVRELVGGFSGSSVATRMDYTGTAKDQTPQLLYKVINCTARAVCGTCLLQKE